MAVEPRLTTAAACCRFSLEQETDVSHHLRASLSTSSTASSEDSCEPSGGFTSNSLRCSICETTFSPRKSLNRHTRSAHRDQRTIQFTCHACNLSCSRRDILLRHIRTQHCEDGRRVQCERCLRYVRMRSLPFHKASAACQATSADTEIIQVGVKGTTYLSSDEDWHSVSFQLPPFTDALLLAAWLFAKLRPWGESAETARSWSGIPKATTSEILVLKGRVYRAVISALTAGDASTDSGLVDAIAILTVVTTMTEGWAASLTHTQGYVRLAKLQIDASGGSCAQYINASSTAPFEDILPTVVPASEVPRCQLILTMTLKLMRLSAVEVIHAPSRYTGPPASMPAVWTRVFLHTQGEWFERYKPQLDAIIAMALSVSGPRIKSSSSETSTQFFYVGP